MSDNNPISIYALVDPRTDEICYVGETYTDIHERLRQHIGSINGTREKQAWLRELRGLGLKPKVKLLRRYRNWKATPIDAEQKWIDRLVKRGAKLLNSCVIRRDPERSIVGTFATMLKLSEAEIQILLRSARGIPIREFIRTRLGLNPQPPEKLTPVLGRPRKPGRPPKAK